MFLDPGRNGRFPQTQTNGSRFSLDDCDAAITADPKYAPGYRCRGAVYYERKDFDRAIAEQDRALGINPRSPQAYWERGRAFAANTPTRPAGQAKRNIVKSKGLRVLLRAQAVLR